MLPLRHLNAIHRDAVTPLDLLILALATWRLAYFIARDHAPFGVMTWLRKRYAPDADKPSILNCIYCSSIWAALVVLVLWFTPFQPVVWLLAVSGAALMLGSYTGASQN